MQSPSTAAAADPALADDEETVPAVEEDLAPCAGTMAVALARAVLKHLSSRDGTNMCSEDLTLRAASSLPEDDQLSIALKEVASPDHPLESRLFAGLSVLARAMDPGCFVGLVDPQVLTCFRLGARALALCELMRQPQENGSKKSSERFTEDELAVVESTIRCFMCVALCALGGWDRAHEISEMIRDGDSSPFRDTNAARMFKVLMACVAQFQVLTAEAVARKTGCAAISGIQADNSARGGVPGTGRTAVSQNTGSSASDIDSFVVLNSIITTLDHSKRWLDPSGSSLEQQMLHITQMAVSAAVLTERTEAMVSRVREQDAVAQRDQRKLFRRLRLSKDPKEMRNIQDAAKDIGTAQETELRRSVLGLHRIACSLWRVIADCCSPKSTASSSSASATPSSDKHTAARISNPHNSNSNNNNSRNSASSATINAGCAITVAECLRGLLLIRAAAPLADRRLLNVMDLNIPVARSVVAALGDASAWSLHVRLTAVLALLRHGDLPPPSPVAAWSISPDVLTARWTPPPALVQRATEMVGEGGLATKPPPPSSRTTSRTAAVLSSRWKQQQQQQKKKSSTDDDEDADGHKQGEDDETIAGNENEERSIAIADFSSNAMEALMMLDEIAIQRERIVTLGFGIAGGKKRGRSRGRNESSGSRSRSGRLKSSSSSSYFMPAQFDECEYLGGNSKVAALVDCLDRLIAISTPDGQHEQQQNHVNISVSTTTSEGSANAPLPPLAESMLSEVKRLRAVISAKVPVAQAVAAEQQRRKMSPRSGRSSPTQMTAASGRRGSPIAMSKTGAGAPIMMTMGSCGSGVKVVRKPKLSVVPSGGVMKNGSFIRFTVSPQYLEMADRGAVELLVSVSHSGDRDPSSRIFKAVDPRQAMAVNIGRHAPGWAMIYVMLRDLSGKLRSKRAGDAENDDDEDGGDAGVINNVSSSVLSVATARFYVVTHGDGTAAVEAAKRK